MYKITQIYRWRRGRWYQSARSLDASVLQQDVPVSADQAENYVLLLVLLSVFAGGTLVLLSLLLLFCHRCCIGGRRYSRFVCPVAPARSRLFASPRRRLPKSETLCRNYSR